MFFIRILEGFLLHTLFDEGEYSINNKLFNPVKFAVVLVLVLNVFFTIYLLRELNSLHLRIYEQCPQLYYPQQ